MRFPLLLLICTSLAASAFAQSASDLLRQYSGKANWDASSGALAFTSSGSINFAEAGIRSFIWEVPAEVKNIRIAKGVTVNGAFHSKSSVTIEGEDRKTSVVYGTDMQSWPKKHGVTAYTICTFQNFGGTMTIRNLTSLNPRAFHVRGFGTLMHVADCDFIDTRDGHGNHSDGFEGGDGSTVDNCYFESGDDIIKVYFDITVTNTTIKMVTNSVPIQLGWGNYSNGAVGTFKNLTIIGDSGRGSDGNAIIAGRRGKYDVTVNIDGCHIENPNGTLVTLYEPTMTLRGEIKNAHIKLKSYDGKHTAGTNLLTVCGSQEKKSSYECAK